MPNLHDYDMDENIIHTVNSNYYDVTAFAQIQKARDSLSLFHTNLRSLSAHFDELQLLLTALKAQFDVIGISETREQAKGYLKNVDFNGYVLHSQHSKSSAGAVALYVKSNLDHFARNDLSILEDEFETIWIEIKSTKGQNVLFCCTYRHPNTDINKFNNYIDNIMQKISKENKLLFIMCDFNLNLLNYESHNDTNDFINTVISHYLLPHILHPTRVTDHSATVIDNIFSNNTSYETVSGNIISQISDHFPQFIILNNVTINYKNCSYAKRDFSNFNKQKFKNDFDDLSMDFIHDTNISLNSKFGLVFQTLFEHVDCHAPLKKLNKKGLKLQSKPWINSKILRLIKYRDKLLRKLNKKFTHNNNYLYKKFRNCVVSELRASKIEYFNQYFAEHKSNMKMLWTGIKAIINIKRNKFYNISHLTQNGKRIDNPKDIAQVFNQYFTKIAAKIDEDIPRTRKSPFDYLGKMNEPTFFLSPTDSAEVESIISDLKKGKSVGPYSIPCDLLKVLNELISPLLVILINESFSTGIFPDKLKIAKVIALHKKSATDDPANYRPISLLSVFSKIFEKIMHKRLYNFLEVNDILHPLQFGFRKNTLHSISSIDFGIYLHAIFHSVFTFTVQSPQNLRSNPYNRKSENGS